MGGGFRIGVVDIRWVDSPKGTFRVYISPVSLVCRV